MGVRTAAMPLDGPRTVLIGYAGEALRHERLFLQDVGDGSWVVLTPDEDMFIEDLSRADSLRICGPNRELPRGIGEWWFRIVWVCLGTLLNSWKCSEMKHDSLLWWFLVELKMLRDNEKRVVVHLWSAEAAVPIEIVVPAEVLDADQGGGA